MERDCSLFGQNPLLLELEIELSISCGFQQRYAHARKLREPGAVLYHVVLARNVGNIDIDIDREILHLVSIAGRNANVDILFLRVGRESILVHLAVNGLHQLAPTEELIHSGLDFKFR